MTDLSCISPNSILGQQSKVESSDTPNSGSAVSHSFERRFCTIHSPWI